MIFLSALAAAIGFRMNLFNIGVEGQYRHGVVRRGRRSPARRFVPGHLNVVLDLVVAMVAGSVWAGIAGILKVTRGVSEVISTIMLNAIALTLVGYFLNTYGEQAGNSRRTTEIEESSQLAGWTPFLDRDGAVWTLCDPRGRRRHRRSPSCSTAPASASISAPPACPRPRPSPPA